MSHLATTSTSTRSAVDLHRATAQVLERIMAAFSADKVARAFGGIKPELLREQWAAELVALEPHEIDRGLGECRRRDFVPGIGEFVRMCRPALDPEYAWHEAQEGVRARDRGERGVWSHPAVWRAACAMNHEIRTGSFAQYRKRWEMFLGREFERGWGDDVPEVQQRIGHQPTVRAIPPKIRSELAALSRKWKTT